MRIDILTPFKHGTQAFTQGDRVTVPDTDGAYFVSHGWAKEAGADDSVPASVTGATTLDTHSSQVGVGDSNG